MTDQQRFDLINGTVQQVAYLRNSLPKSSQSGCACDERGHCAHHANVWNQLDEAITRLTLAASQLRFPNGAGDKAAW